MHKFRNIVFTLKDIDSFYLFVKSALKGLKMWKNVYFEYTALELYI